MLNALFLLVPFLLSLVLTPVVKHYSLLALSYAKENKRTVHHGKISRIGGVAIYLAFMITMAVFVDVDRTINGIVLSSSIMFFAGLIDDLIDMRPLVKLCFQLISAFVLLYFGVGIDVLRLPFGLTFDSPWISAIFTIVWVVGITNALNLIDGLDGLAGGMSVVVLFVVGSLSIIDRRFEIVALAFILASAIMGFLVYNAHPASIFMGDCGSLFLGFLIASISLVGFKGSTVLTLALPMLLLLLPIVDTLSAILRRMLKGQRFLEADKNHIHHMLMQRFGHRNTVIIMCGITALFGLSAFVYMLNRVLGLFVMLVLFLGLDLFIESAAVISKDFHPLIGTWRRLVNMFKKNRKRSS